MRSGIHVGGAWLRTCGKGRELVVFDVRTIDIVRIRRAAGGLAPITGLREAV